MPPSLDTLLFAVAVLVCLPLEALSHSRWQCPEPRASGTNIKSGPCGDETGDFSGEPIEVQPGPFRVIWEESSKFI
jgi:hypothetical protein